MTLIVASGISISEEPGPEEPIARVATAITAFVGRTLKGPVNEPVQVESFAAFQQVFGGLWQPSMLAYAVEQYFDQGGGVAVIVRVINGARAPTLSLPAGLELLTLAGLSPGSREYLRASVDYDGIGENEPSAFNLVVQRVRTPGSELVEEQEIFRRLSVLPDAERFVVEVLGESRLVRTSLTLPRQRPDRTTGGVGGLVGYVHSNTDGDDGGPLTDYDIIGSSVHRTGLFALQNCAQFNLLCIPPLARDRDVGMSALLVAARLCRERQALLLVEPPLHWTSPAAALSGMRDWPFQSHDAVMYFPRVFAFDRLRGRIEVFGACAAAAGLIARADAATPVWAPADREDGVLRSGARPSCAVSDGERARLAQLGVNTLQSARTGQRNSPAPRTLAAEASTASDWRYLAARRLALFIIASVERGTRWAVFEPNCPALRTRVRAQVQAFLCSLDEEGAFVEHEAEDSYFVICDERLNSAADVAEGRLRLLLGLAAMRPGEFHAVLLTHLPGASRVRSVSVNRLATAQRRVAQEIETQILRGLIAG